MKRPKSHTNPFKITPWCVKRPKSHTNPNNYLGSRCAEPWMGLSLRDGYFARRLFGSINWCRAPATPKPGPLLNRPLATSRPVSVGPKERQRARQGAPLRTFGLSGRAVECAVSRSNTHYRLPLPLEYIFPLLARSPRRVGHPLRSTASLAASETIGDDFFEGLKEVASDLRN